MCGFQIPCKVPNCKPEDEVCIKQKLVDEHWWHPSGFCSCRRWVFGNSVSIIRQKLLAMFWFEVRSWECEEDDGYQHVCTQCDMKQCQPQNDQNASTFLVRDCIMDSVDQCCCDYNHVNHVCLDMLESASWCLFFLCLQYCSVNVACGPESAHFLFFRIFLFVAKVAIIHP